MTNRASSPLTNSHNANKTNPEFSVRVGSSARTSLHPRRSGYLSLSGHLSTMTRRSPADKQHLNNTARAHLSHHPSSSTPRSGAAGRRQLGDMSNFQTYRQRHQFSDLPDSLRTCE
ncbi:hypothetical protein ElyMa_006458700 [Elysia marginata]|uniref:Uncharacterized protein n=1 Tax=Elysia marginata TaxID=1093978 RepID=A0AAV4I225_9GAST|nr:hypothetical protein ElyMa_006458700 [Elysia marginata]